MRSVRAATDGKRVPPTRGRLRLAWPATAATLAVLALLLVAATIPLSVLARQSVLSNLAQAIIFVPATAAGLLIARRQPGNPIGWLLLVVGAGALITEVAGLYTRLAYDPGRHLPLGPEAVLLALSWPALLLAFGLVVLLFPEGRLPSPRWRWVLRAYLAGTVILTGGVYAVAISILAGPRYRLTRAAGWPRSTILLAGPRCWCESCSRPW